jgi:heterodisulfide reductase subunit C/nitrate reductase gamma subunit
MLQNSGLNTLLFYMSLAVCLAGILYRVFTWFHDRVIFPNAGAAATLKRMGVGFIGVFRTPAGGKIPGLVRSLVGKVLLQVHILKQHPLRWVMHIFICYGFLYLLLFHALDDIVTRTLFSGYEPTLHPFRFLRNLFGLILAAGLGIAVYRRSTVKLLREITGKGDRAALAILVFIVFSGFFLESARILSPRMFDDMVRAYASDDPAEIAGLRAYWAKEFGVVFPGTSNSMNLNRLDLGRMVHEESCAFCHARPDTAIAAWPISRMLQPVAGILNQIQADQILWQIHVLACFTGLALLPFTKFFHILATPVNLLVRAGREDTAEEKAEPAADTARILGLDACTHCGVCSRYCSVEPAYRILGNPDILPSEKLRSLQFTGMKKNLPPGRMMRMAEGSFACTACGRCTDLCPSEIDLQELWTASRADLIQAGYLNLHGWARTRSAAEWGSLLDQPGPAAPGVSAHLGLTDRAETFWACVQCTTCTSVCPVVGASDDPESELDLTPQQVMNLMRLQMKELALGARMVWNCVTCYQCQEHCPQGVRVADVLYELRNLAGERMGAHLRKPDRDGNR